MMVYKGYTASIEYDSGDDTFHGRVLHIRDVITFEGKSVAQLKREFATSVDAYLDLCAEQRVEPEKPFSGRLLLRMEPGLHREVAVAADKEKVSINTWIVAAIQGLLKPSRGQLAAAARISVRR